MTGGDRSAFNPSGKDYTGKPHTPWTVRDRANAVEQAWPKREALDFNEVDYRELLDLGGDELGWGGD